MEDTTQNTTTGEQVAPVVDEGTGGLPSEQQSFDGFALTDELKGKFKDGKLNGRFESMDDVLTKLKEAEDFRANTIRDAKANATTADANAAAAQAEADIQVTQQTTIMEMMPDFQANGYQLTQAMQDKAVAEGIDIRDLKLGAIEFKEKVQTAHGITGGAENYQAMLDWGSQNMTESQKQSFDKEVVSGMSEYAIKGLYLDFSKAQADGTAPENTRIEGSTTVQGIKPYADRRELFKDRDYINSVRGRNDKAAQAHHRKRLNATSNDVLGI